MNPRDVTPFVGDLLVPYFMDRRMIAEWMEEIGCDRKEAVALLTKKWKREKGHGD